MDLLGTKKKAQFNFVWLFAIIIGGAILLLAIYGAVKSGDTQKELTDTTTAKSISILTDPLQAGFSDGSYGVINFREETRIDSSCLDNELGSMKISVSTKSGPKGEWTRQGVDVLVPNKYIFSQDKISGKDYVVFSKPFNFPYKISDLIFLIPKDYCFIDAPNAIADDLKRIKVPKIEVGFCNSSDSVRVCFKGGSECDIKVSCANTECSYGNVEKYGIKTDFVGNLIYGAIFSDKDIYDCNLRRLMYRNGIIAEELMEKADLMNARDCSTSLKPDLYLWKSRVLSASSTSISGLKASSEELIRRNKMTRCKLWK